MAKILDILKTEKERKSTGDFNTVHLYKTLERITKNLQTIDLSDAKHAEASINSYLGVLSHSASYNIKQQLNLVA